MTLTKKFLADAAEKVALAGVAAFLAVLVPPLSLSRLHAAEAAGLAAAVRALVAIVQGATGTKGVASFLPASLLPVRTVHTPWPVGVNNNATTGNTNPSSVVFEKTIPLTKEQQVAKARPPHVPSPGKIPPGPVQVTKAKPVEHAAKAQKAVKKAAKRKA